MVKSMLVILMLIYINGCSQKQTELTPITNEVKNSTHDEESNSVSTIEFVPEHIINSTIEVVSH